MDFVIGLHMTQQGHNAVWMIVHRLTKTTHFLLVKVNYSLDKLAKTYIQEVVRLHFVPFSIISYRDLRFTSRFWQILQHALETKLRFSTAFHPQMDGDKVFLKISPRKGVLRFGKRGKLSPSTLVHLRYRSDPSHILQAQPLELKDNFSYEERSVAILAKEVKELRKKTIPLVKVLWKHHANEEATWEQMKDIRNQYPNLFNFEDEIS
eukprot:XP_015578560.1 uncharacterized protein LOC107261743 [Ricinus communis]